MAKQLNEPVKRKVLTVEEKLDLALKRLRKAHAQIRRYKEGAVVIAVNGRQHKKADRAARLAAAKLQEKLTRIPMETILAKVPGEGAREKAQTIGVARQSYYRWVKDGFRPNAIVAARIAKLTGYSISEVTGRG